MKKFAFVALFAVSAFAAEWKGTISDAKCGAAHADASEKSMKCVNACVKGGQKAVLVADGKVLQIANQDKVAEHLGHKVTINGKLEGDAITVATVEMNH
jgi:hypothetical protein